MTSTTLTEDLQQYVDRFRARVLQDALTEATGTYWHRRATALETAHSRPGDYQGQASPERIRARDARLRAAARACRRRASLAVLHNAPEPGEWSALQDLNHTA
jgi:hypothetical protein